MTIKVKCPTCKARNTLTENNMTCRRCKEDLLLLYKIKIYSYQYRLQLLQILLTQSEYAKFFAQQARFLVKENQET